MSGNPFEVTGGGGGGGDDSDGVGGSDGADSGGGGGGSYEVGSDRPIWEVNRRIDREDVIDDAGGSGSGQSQSGGASRGGAAPGQSRRNPAEISGPSGETASPNRESDPSPPEPDPQSDPASSPDDRPSGGGGTPDGSRDTGSSSGSSRSERASGGSPAPGQSRRDRAELSGPSGETARPDRESGRPAGDVSGEGPGANPSQPERHGDLSRREIAAVARAANETEDVSGSDLRVKDRRVTLSKEARRERAREQVAEQVERGVSPDEQVAPRASTGGGSSEAPATTGHVRRGGFDVDLDAGDVRGETDVRGGDAPTPTPSAPATTGEQRVDTGSEVVRRYTLAESGQVKLRDAVRERAADWEATRERWADDEGEETVRDFKNQQLVDAVSGEPRETAGADPFPGENAAAGDLGRDGQQASLFGPGRYAGDRGVPDELPSGDIRREVAGQETRAPPSAGIDIGRLEKPGIGTGAAQEVAPHAAMSLDQAGLEARAEREQIFAERAERGFEDITSGRLPSAKEVGAMYFQGVEIAERSLIDAGREFSEPIRGEGPTLPGGNTVGDVGANLVDFTVGGAAAGVGGAQIPVTAAADTQIPGVMERDATVSRRQLDQPRIATPELAPGERPTAETFARQVADLNPNLDAEDVSVSRDGDRYQVQTDLSTRERRERIAAANEGVNPSGVSFIGEGEQARPITFERDPEGQTPAEVTGPVGQVERTVETQVTMAQDAPYATGALIALPTAEAVPAGIRGYRATRGTTGTVNYRAITSERGASGELPSYETRPSASTRRAVSESETRARQQPDAVQEAMGTEQVLYHTTGERLGRELTVTEGASELPGLFVSPDASPIGLSRVASGERASLLDRIKPTRPDLSRQPDRVAAFQGDRIAAMPESARGTGYELRNPSGRVVERGLGRGEAKARAEGSELNVRPQSNTPGYRFLTEQAEPGTAYTKPRASRSSELEGIFPPESRFQQRGKVAVELPSGERVPADIYRRAPEQPGRAGRTRTDAAAETMTGGEISRSYTPRPTARQGFTTATYATATGALSNSASGARASRTPTGDTPSSRTARDISQLPERIRSATEQARSVPGRSGSRRSEVSRPSESAARSEGVSYDIYDPSRGASDVSSSRRSTSRDTRSRPSPLPESPVYGYPTSSFESTTDMSTTTTTTTTTTSRTTGGTPTTGLGTPFDPPSTRQRPRPDPDQDREPPEFVGGRVEPYDVAFQNPIATGGQVLFGTVGGFPGPRGPAPETRSGGPVDETGLEEFRGQSPF